jgi:2,3-dihydroxyphenylpropionate 1,2-dioxygenase
MDVPVLGIGASHTTLMNTHWDKVVHLDRAERFRDALTAAREALVAAKPETVLIFGSNHFRGFYLDLIPAFTIGVGECIASGEAGTPAGPQRVDIPLARHIAGSLLADSFDLAFSAKLQVDHGITHAMQYMLRDFDVPIVPIVINVFAPPLPTIGRCAELGAAVRRAIASFGDRRVAIIGSGGLSHRLPWPDWRAPVGEDDAFLVEAFLNGRTQWKEYEVRRREIVIKATEAGGDAFRVNTAFDRAFLALIERGELSAAVARSGDLLVDAGNGGQEIRTWVAMNGALAGTPGRVLAYEDIPEWLTGMAVTVLVPADGGEAVPL